jgi:hypothetical protein
MDIVRMELSVDLYTRLLAHVPSTSRLADRLRSTLKVERGLPTPETYYWFMGTERDALNLAVALDAVAPYELPRLLEALQGARPSPSTAATRQD